MHIININPQRERGRDRQTDRPADRQTDRDRARTQISYTHESFHNAAQGSQFHMKSPL